MVDFFAMEKGFNGSRYIAKLCVSSETCQGAEDSSNRKDLNLKLPNNYWTSQSNFSLSTAPIPPD